MVTSGWPAKLFVVGSLLLLITSAIAECGGHGHLDGDVCVCDNSWPDAGHAGWVGESCQVPVFGGGDGEELTSACTSKGCDSLDNGAWICFTKTSE